MPAGARVSAEWHGGVEVNTWIMVIGDVAARDLARAGWRRLALAQEAPRPAAGDRIAVLRTHRPRYVTEAAFAGTADVRGDDQGEVVIRHRFVTPEGHAVPLTSLRLHLASGLTHERLGARIGTVASLDPRDFARIEDALREVALAYGPQPKRPAHRRPRTPGRRALTSARILARRLPAVR